MISLQGLKVITCRQISERVEGKPKHTRGVTLLRGPLGSEIMKMALMPIWTANHPQSKNFAP